ncbi:MAG: carboxypeptidase regulatory-like domain-containing protein [Caldilineaceae bacterium]
MRKLLLSTIFLGFLTLIVMLALHNSRPVDAQTGPGAPAAQGRLIGQVMDTKGPVAGATVKVQLTSITDTSDEDGSFVLAGLVSGETFTVTAWAPGHYIAWTTGVADGEPISLTLEAYYVSDNHAYEWFAEDGIEGSASCGSCHPSYGEWKQSAHGTAASNPRFLGMYMGTDMDGNRSPDPIRNNLGITQPPDLTKPYYGPGFLLDNPNRTGNCATCHTPVAGKISNAQNCGWSGCHASTTSGYAGPNILDPGVSPIQLTGDAAEGISCEFCHKTEKVYINSKTGLPFEDSPGILSMRLLRPEAGHDLFFGTLDDVVRPELAAARDAYLPAMQESSFCAGCHYGVMGGVVGNMQVTGGVLVYSSYSEWLDSPYSDPETGKSCQDCHMPAADYKYAAFPAKGGPVRPEGQVHSHAMPGGYDEELLQNALSLSANARMVGGRLWVTVDVTNDQTGHDVPTDSPLRHVILLVEATDAADQKLVWRSGGRLPAWAGGYEGEPGRIFAKTLRDDWTGEMPTGAIWRPVTIASDTRIPALSTRRSSFSFAPPDAGISNIRVRLIYRRAWPDLSEWKGWNDPDILMEETTLTYP